MKTTEPQFYKNCTQLKKSRIMVLAPHPDDETFGCAGTILEHSKLESDIKTIFASDGSNCYRNHPNNTLNNTNASEIIFTRKKEAQNAAALLKTKEPVYLEFEDGKLAENLGELTKQISIQLNSFEPEILFLTSDIDTHSDHRTCNTAAWSALNFNASVTQIWYYEIHQPLNINTYVDITESEEKKRIICDIYQSQQALFNYTQAIIGLNRYRALKCKPDVKLVEGFVKIQRNNT